VSPDASRLYFVDGPRPNLLGFLADVDIRCGRLHNGESDLIGRIPGTRVPISPRLLQLFLSPDGQWLAVLLDGATSNLFALPTSGGSMRRLTDFHDGSNLIARSVSWSRESNFLFAAMAEIETDVVLLQGLIT
jgi:hypothetical protein